MPKKWSGRADGWVRMTGCDCIGVPYAALTGLLAGALVVFSCVFFDKIRVDDPVGAISVHGVCGAWGTLAVGLFANDLGLFVGGGTTQLGIQATGVAAAFLWAFPVSFTLFCQFHLDIPEYKRELRLGFLQGVAFTFPAQRQFFWPVGSGDHDPVS